MKSSILPVKTVLPGKQSRERIRNFAFRFIDPAGFTFLNMLFSLGIFTLIVSSLFPLLLFFYKSAEDSRDISSLEWEFFSEQAIIELKAAENPSVFLDKLDFTDRFGQRVSYQKYGNLIRRQVNRTGHEIILNHTASVQFSASQQSIQLHVTSETGKERRLTVRSIYEK